MPVEYKYVPYETLSNGAHLYEDKVYSKHEPKANNEHSFAKIALPMLGIGALCIAIYYCLHYCGCL